jgi:hypothetical protein
LLPCLGEVSLLVIVGSQADDDAVLSLIHNECKDTKKK